MFTNLDQIKAAASLEQVIGRFVKLQKNGVHFVGLCPFHTEKTPSFTVTPAKGMYHCFGCGKNGDVFRFVEEHQEISFPDAVRFVAGVAGITPVEDKRNAASVSSEKPERPEPARVETSKLVGSEVKPKLVATYDYQEADGTLRYQVCRFEPGRNGKPKHFSQRRPMPDGSWAWGLTAGWYHRRSNGSWMPTQSPVEGDVELPEVERLLWRLPQIIAASEVVVCEGEKDVQTLEALGFVATTPSAGASQPWLDSFSEVLRGKRVVIFPDNDSIGETHGRKMEAALQKVAAEIVYVRLPQDFKDITAYVEAGRTVGDVVALIQQVEQEAIRAEQRYRGLLTPREVITNAPGGANAFYDPTKRPKGLQTGFYEFDEKTLGLFRREMSALAGRPSMGKSALAFNIALQIARQNKSAVAIFSLETPGVAVLQRMVCALASVDSHRFRSGYCTPEEIRAVQLATEEILDLPLYIDDTAGLTFEEMRRKTLLFAEKEDLGLVVLDYLQLLAASKGKQAENRTREVSVHSRGTKLLADEANTHMLVLSQLSRACEARPGDHRPMLSDLKESGSIEQDCDLIGFIYREEVYRPDKAELRGRAEWLLAKQRNGPIGKVRLDFHHKFTRFDNASSYWNGYQEAA